MKKLGFCLVEVLISSTLTLFFLIGVAQLILISLAAKRNSDFLQAATNLASSRLEQIKSLPWDSPALKPGASSEEERSPVTGRILYLEWRVEDVTERIKRVILTIHQKTAYSRKIAFVLLLSRELCF